MNTPPKHGDPIPALCVYCGQPLGDDARCYNAGPPHCVHYEKPQPAADHPAAGTATGRK
jgi:hypothetical protein